MRRSWYYEQLGAVPVPTAKNQTRYQATLQSVSYTGALSSQGGILLDLRYFEIGLKASRRWFLDSGGDGALLRSALASDETTLGAEIARHFASERGIFGRLGAEYLSFLPAGRHALRFNLTTGVLPVTGPWGVRLESNYIMPFRTKGTFASLRFETGRRLLGDTHPLSLGGFFSWASYSGDAVASGPAESTQLSVGPVVDWASAFGTWRLLIPVRAWIDREVVSDRGSSYALHPLSFTTSVNLSWTWLL